MLLKQLLEAVKFQISETVKYEWDCYGNNANYLDFSYAGNTGVVSCIYDSENQHVYEITFCPPNNKLYRWINPLNKDEYLKECKSKEVSPIEAWDGLEWIDCEIFEDIIEKISSFYENGTYNSNILVSIELTDKQWEEFYFIANFNSITPDELANKILAKAISQEQQLIAADKAIESLKNGELDGELHE